MKTDLALKNFLIPCFFLQHKLERAVNHLKVVMKTLQENEALQSMIFCMAVCPSEKERLRVIAEENGFWWNDSSIPIKVTKRT